MKLLGETRLEVSEDMRVSENRGYLILGSLQ